MHPILVCRARTILVVAVLFVSIGPFPTHAVAQVSGNTYLSPSYGFSLTWDQPWNLFDEVSEEFEQIQLTNGTTFASVTGAPLGGSSVPGTLAFYSTYTQSDPSISNAAPLLDVNGDPIAGASAESAFNANTYTVEFDDGSTVDFAEYVEVRPIAGRDAAVIVTFLTEAFNFGQQFPRMLALLDGLAGTGTSLLTAADPTASSTTPFAGEPSPAFVSGPWRVAVVRSALGAEIDGVSLNQRGGKEWLVVVADVTNWSDNDEELNTREFFARSDDVAKPVRAAPSSTRAVGERLGLSPFDDDLKTLMLAGETRRIALVFSLPENGAAIALIHGVEILPITHVLGVAINGSSLPRPTIPPEPRLGVLTTATDGHTVRIEFRGEPEPLRLRLIGVQPPPKDGCFEHEAEKVLDDLAGQDVIVEIDHGLDAGSASLIYLWIEESNGTRTLINQALIAEGLANAERIPDSSRFGAWISESAKIAESAGNGLWSECA